MKLQGEGFPYELIQELSHEEIVTILATVFAREKKLKEESDANANRR